MKQFDPDLEKGFMITFSRFLRFLIVVNRINMLKFTRNELRDGISVEESASLLLNLIENSKGYKRAQQVWSVSHAKNGLCHTESYKDYARSSMNRSSMKSNNKMVNSQNEDPAEWSSKYSSSRINRAGRVTDRYSQYQKSCLRDNSQDTKRLRSLSKNKKVASTLNYKDESLIIFEKYSEPLSQIFSLYAGIGEPLNSTKMKSIKFNSMLKDAGILDKVNSISSQPKSSIRRRSGSRSSRGQLQELEKEIITQVDIDLIFSQLTG